MAQANGTAWLLYNQLPPRQLKRVSWEPNPPLPLITYLDALVIQIDDDYERWEGNAKLRQSMYARSYDLFVG